MKLSDYISDWKDRERLAAAIGSSAQYIYQIERRWRGRQPSPKLAQAIERATGGAVTRADLRPDIWAPEDRARAQAKAA